MLRERVPATGQSEATTHICIGSTRAPTELLPLVLIATHALALHTGF